MSQTTDKQPPEVVLIYRDRPGRRDRSGWYFPGQALAATTLARRIEHCFRITVGLEATSNGEAGLKINDRFVFCNPSGDDLFRHKGEIFAALNREIPQVHDEPEDGRQADGENDPDHQLWMRSVCSGE